MNQRNVWKRLAAYARPYGRQIAWAILLLLLATAAELAGPLLAKVAIDEHMLSIHKTWYRLDGPPESSGEPVRSVQVAGVDLVREDWLHGALFNENRREASIVTEGTAAYLVDGAVPAEGERRFTPLPGEDNGRPRYQLAVSVGGREFRWEAVRLKGEELRALYAYEIRPLVLMGAGYVGLILLAAGLGYWQMVTLQTAAQRIIQRMRIDLYSHLQRLPISYFDATPVGAVVSRVTNDTEAIRELYVSVVSTFAQNGAYLVGILAALFLLDPSLALLTCALLPILAALVILYRRYSSRTFAESRRRLSDMNAMINETMQNMAVVQAFGREDTVRGEFAALNEAYYQARMRENRLQALLLRPAVDLVYKLALTGVVWYMGAHSLKGAVSFGVLFAFVDYLGRFFEPVNLIMSRLSQLQQAQTAANRVFAVLDTAPEIPAGREELPRPTGRVVFDDVWFAYQGEDYVLKGISFVAEPGQTVALVGHTGSGKSSLMNLLLGFYQASRGRIRIDGKDVRKLDPRSLRRHIGLVLQDPYLFAGDVAFNVRLYDENISGEAVRDAIRAVQADVFVERLPGGLHEPVTERGATLSSGQRQLLSFARALARDPAILVLDEATASIDSGTESAIQEALHVLSRGRTTFIIAHRLSTIQHADQILVLNRGVIAERGTHAELMARDGIYRKMYLLQQGGALEADPA